MRRYLNAEQAARYLGIGEGPKATAVIYQWVHRGKLPHSKVGRILRFDMQALDRWMAEHARHVEAAASLMLAGPMLLQMVCAF